MKKRMKAETLKALFKEHDLQLSDQQTQQFIAYFHLLVSWNEKMNLTAITQWDEVIVKHFLDSVLSKEVIDFTTVERLIDIGTGAGFPGIPLKIMFPHLEVTLLDALNKRLNFLEHVVEELGLDQVTLIHGRAEDWAKTEHRESYDLCVSRAVSQLNVLCEYCLPFIALGGSFVSYKGAKTMQELEDSHQAIDLLGGQLAYVTDEATLDNQVKRGFVVIKKVKVTPDKYPRRAGKPLKKPL